MEPRTYHHKDLKNALINAALAVVEREGSEAVSLRDLAAQVGVSRAAPYRHFADRDALLAAVAARGFADLCAIYMAALAGSGTGRERLRAALVAYLDFARHRQGLHALMFKSDFLGRTPPPAVLIPPANRAYELLWEGVRGAFPRASDTWVKARTATMMSTVVGFLVLDESGRFKPFMFEPMTREDLVLAVLEAAIGEG
jgi:AcrR family transcriptional regulator